MAPSWFQILLVLVVIVLLFGRGKISDLMGDVAKGIKSFKRGMSDDEEEESESADKLKSIEHDEAEPVKPAKSSRQSKAKAS